MRETECVQYIYSLLNSFIVCWLYKIPLFSLCIFGFIGNIFLYLQTKFIHILSTSPSPLRCFDWSNLSITENKNIHCFFPMFNSVPIQSVLLHMFFKEEQKE